MPTTPTQTEAERRAAETTRYRAILDNLLDMAHDLAQNIQADAMQRAANPDQDLNATTPDPTPAFDRIARTIRRTIISPASSTNSPPHPAPPAAPGASQQPPKPSTR